jgi:hypothetical protein
MQEVKAKPRQDVVEMLEELLREAKSGELQGVAIAGAMRNCQTFNCFITGGYTMAMVGEIHILARDVIDCEVEIRHSPVSGEFI